MISETQLLFDIETEPMRVGVMQFQAKGLEPPQHCEADPSSSNRAEIHSFHIVAASDAVSDVPAALDGIFVRRQIISPQRQPHHDDMLCDADAVRAGNFGDSDMV